MAVGTLPITDVSKEIELPFIINGEINAFGGERIAAEAHTKTNRQDYHLTFNKMIEAGPMVGDDVNINLTVEAARPLPKPAEKPAETVPPARQDPRNRKIKVAVAEPPQKPVQPQNQDTPAKLPLPL